jgi:hypothetical protein
MALNLSVWWAKACSVVGFTSPEVEILDRNCRLDTAIPTKVPDNAQGESDYGNLLSKHLLKRG